MRRSTLRWGFGIAIVVSVSGCASLLGDFTSSNETNGDDGGPKTDGAPSTADGSNGDDGGPSPDGSNDGSSQDGPTGDAADAAQPVIPLACVESGHGSNRVKLGSIANSGSNDSFSVQLFNTSVGSNNGAYRAYVPANNSSGPGTYHVYSFGSGGGNNVTDIPIPSNNGNVLQVVRYPGGLAAFSQTFLNPTDGAPGSNVLEVIKLPDSANVWSAPVVLADLGTNCMNRMEGKFIVVSAATDDYYAELAFQNCASTITTHTVGHYQNGAGAPGFWPVPPENMELADGGSVPPPADAGAPNFDLAGLALSGTGIYSMTNAGDGPDPGVGSAIFSSLASLAGGASVFQMPLVDPADLMQGLSITSLASTAGVGLAILEANLSSQTVTPIIYTGSVPGSKMATLNPATDLHPTMFASISDLPINDSTYHWESFATPASDNFIGVGSVFPNNNGLNFIWWDGAGNVRAQKTNTASFFYFDATAAGLAIYGGDVAFNGAPLPAIAGLEMVFIQEDSEALTMNDVWATQINCAPQ